LQANPFNSCELAKDKSSDVYTGHLKIFLVLLMVDSAFHVQEELAGLWRLEGAYLFLKKKGGALYSVEFTCGGIGIDNCHKQRK
jgi:hypothetical protein